MNWIINFSVAAVAAVVMQGAAHAAEKFPIRPIRMIVPFPPGGSNDIVGRVIGQQLGTGPNSLVIHVTNYYAKPPARKWEQEPHPRGLMVRI